MRKGDRVKMLYSEYDSETLKKLQNIELEIFSDFATLCEKHGIDYFGVGGTALGLARYGGFIPWDDDIDVVMTRENYDRFLEVAKTEMTEKYRIVNAETVEGFPLTTTRWTMRGTKFKEQCFKELDIDLGIFLDIFCWDNAADNEFKMKCQAWTAWFWGKLLVLRNVRCPVIYYDGWKAKVILAICALVHDIMKGLHISSKYLYRKAEKAAKKYKNVDTKRAAYFFDPTPFTSVMYKEDFLPTEIREYNGIKVRFPKDLDRYLTIRYGKDYMTPPPENKRHNHPPYELQFPKD